jgi:hypothetical protein
MARAVASTTGVGFETAKLVSHMFIFYFGILADLTPPVALASYVGSMLAKSESSSIHILLRPGVTHTPGVERGFILISAVQDILRVNELLPLNTHAECRHRGMALYTHRVTSEITAYSPRHIKLSTL